MSWSIYIAGHPFPIEWPTVPWFAPGGYNSHLESCTGAAAACPAVGGFPAGVVPIKLPANRAPHAKRYRNRRGMGALGRAPLPLGQYAGPWKPDALRAAQGIIRQFVIHHDGCLDAEMTHHVLHNERGLSVHFIVQNDGTIFQCLDLALAGFQCRTLNETSIGVELNNRGEIAWNEKRHTREDYYKRTKWAAFERPIVKVTVNGQRIRTFGYTEQQRKAMHALDHALRRALPNLPATYPQIAPGVQAWGTLDPMGLHQYAGWLGHYHETSNKWDPGPWYFDEFFGAPEAGAGRRVFPLGLQEMPDPTVQDEGLAAQTEVYYQNNERGESGFFPLARWSDWFLWHTGVHLHAAKGTPVLAPFAGSVVAAQRAPEAPGLGSVDFVLMRHEFAIGRDMAKFYTLYMHLGDGAPGAPAPGWRAARPVGRDGHVLLLDEPVGEGALLGYVGEAGPGALRAPQLHFSVFSRENQGPGFWEVIPGMLKPRLFQDRELLAKMDEDGDAALSRAEILHFFRDARALAVRRKALYAVSEWTDTPEWMPALREVFVNEPEAAEALYTAQIQPTLWWSVAVARHAGLPRDGEVYHYQPITFIKWMNERMRSAPPPAAQPSQGQLKPKQKLKDDWDDEDGESFASEEDFRTVGGGVDLTLEEAAEGYK